MKMRPLRFVVFMLLLVLLLSALPGLEAGAQTSSTIRVWLRRLKVEDVMHIKVQGSYMLEDGSMTFSDGAELVVALRGDQLILHTNAIAIAMGKNMKLVRCDSEQPAALLLQGNTGLYEGDLMLTADNGVIRPVLHIFVEDYLLGVVPYEMGDSFPLEALKAQAIAARTYALRKSGANEEYDVEDTTNDQAYRGRASSSPLSEQAVRETEGLCGTYRGELVYCYYSASNGGQTELGRNAWPEKNANGFDYMDMRDDPYDYENDASVVKRYTIKKKPGKEGADPALASMLVSAMEKQLQAYGCAADPALVRFDEIVDVRAISPMYDEPSRLMSQMEFDVRISVRSYTFKDAAARSAAADYTPAPDATPSPTPAPTATPAFSPYTKIKEIITVSVPVFPTLEKALGLSINVYRNELVTVLDIGSGFMIEFRRFGHGVGMSQRGAEQMARKYGMSFEEILKFYYPRMDVSRYTAERKPLPTIDTMIMGTPAPSPSPTPRPTHMPVSKEKLPRGAYIAVVSNIDADSSLNLRESPSLSAEILRRLYLDQELIVVKETKDGWAHVKTDVIEGYVKSEYLQRAGK